MPPLKKLPKPRTRYYVDQPVVVVPLADFERLIQHLVKMTVMENESENVRRGLKARNTLLLKEAWATIKQARNHYKIPEK